MNEKKIKEEVEEEEEENFRNHFSIIQSTIVH